MHSNLLLFRPRMKEALLEEIIKNYEASSEDLAVCISEEMGAPLWLSQVAQVASGLGHFKDTLAVLKDLNLSLRKITTC